MPVFSFNTPHNNVNYLGKTYKNSNGSNFYLIFRFIFHYNNSFNEYFIVSSSIFDEFLIMFYSNEVLVFFLIYFSVSLDNLCLKKQAPQTFSVLNVISVKGRSAWNVRFSHRLIFLNPTGKHYKKASKRSQKHIECAEGMKNRHYLIALLDLIVLLVTGR